MPMQLVTSIQPGITKFSNDIVVRIQECNDVLANVKFEDLANKSYSMISVFVSDWILLINTVITYATTIAMAIRSNSIVFGFILSITAAAIILLVVTKTMIGEYYVNVDTNSFAQEKPKLNESPKTKKTIRYTAASESPTKTGGETVHKIDPVIAVSSDTNIKVSPKHASVVDDIQVDKISTYRDDVSSECNSEDSESITKVAKVPSVAPKIPIVPFAIDFPGHRTIPIEIQMDYNARKRTPEKPTQLDIDTEHNKHSISPTKVSPKNKTALEVNTYRLLSNISNDRVTQSIEIDREEALKGLLLKTVESRLTPSKAPSIASSISTSRATYVHDTSRSTIPQTHVIPTSAISPIKPTFTPPKTVVTPPRAAKMKSSTGTQTDKSTLRDGIASSRSNRTPTANIGDEYNHTSRKIVNVPISLPSSLSKRGAVMAPPKGTPPREVSRTSFSSVGSGSSDGNRRKTPSKSSFSSTGSGEDRGSSYIGIGPPPLTSLLTETYDSVINMNVTPSSNSKRLGSR